jgi:hypothetical protein
VPHDVVTGLLPVHRQDGHHQCTGGGYDEPVGFEVWELWSRFCNEECRISQECDKLSTSMW